MKHSTLAGIYWAQHHGYTHVLKTRTDITISNLDRLILRLNLYSHNQIGLLMWHKSYRHLVEQVMFGPIDKMLTMWNWQYIQCHTESQMMKEYFEKTQLDGSPEDFDNIKKHFHFFAKDTFITNSVIEWKKYDCPNIIWPYVYGLAEAIY